MLRDHAGNHFSDGEGAPGLRPVTRKASTITVSERPAAAAPPESTPTLLDIIRTRTLIVTELDPPKSLGLEKLIEGARALKEAGTDFVTLADNSLAILRVSNL